MSTRRTFLNHAGILSASMFLIKPEMLFAKPASLKVGLQLYSMRDYIAKDVKGVIEKVAKAGYTEVETYGYDTVKRSFWGLSPKDFKTLLSDNGITSSSGHYGMEQYLDTQKEDDIKACIEAAHEVGQKTIVVPHLADKYRKTVSDFKTLAQNMNKLGELCKQANLKTGYHNHNFEFVPIDGVTLYDILLKETDRKLVDFEMDIYWVVRAGQDPVKLIKENPGRFTMWHIKDMDKNKRELNTEIGSGSIDYKEIFKYRELSGVKHIYMEQENFGMDAYSSITQSAKYIKNTLIG
ncbi:MAG: sugar phosphate isomerase/epimerase [Mucilaginibacter sp.]|nr:sugar phosphate isomerase/epimerase [Mucilaginibacter sp.]MDB5111554.1 sugar phosphate isomerase/epimerase [Mucilaginibacter sp.]